MKKKQDAPKTTAARYAADFACPGLSVEVIRGDILDNLYTVQGRLSNIATQHDWYMALAYMVRDRVLHRWMKTMETYMKEKNVKSVCYFSAEFLMGPHLMNTLINLGATEQVRAALTELGQDLQELANKEEEPGLGQGGLGRLAACLLDSLATLEVFAAGYGIRYEFGIFWAIRWSRLLAHDYFYQGTYLWSLSSYIPLSRTSARTA